MMKYLRYFFMSFLLAATTVGFMWGGGWLWLGYVLTLIIVVGGDPVSGDDLTVPNYSHKWLLNLLLFAALPLQLVMLTVLAWMCSDSGDALGLGGWVQSSFGWDMFSARAATGPIDLFGGVMSAGLLIATAGTNIGHELTHRTNDKFALTVGRWMLALTCDTSFSIEHVYGHHNTIGTPQDPATARRGENAWAFAVRSAIGQSKSAWRIENERLRKLGYSPWSWRNRMPRGIAMSGVYFLGFYLIGGMTGLIVFLGATIWGRSLLEFVNYFEHYGLARVPGTPVKPHHSWNSNKRMSGFVLYNLTRHSHHHAEGDLPFWHLRPYSEAPMLNHGYLTTILITMIPPLWHRLMIPKLKEWDERYATPEERRLTTAQNAASGLPELMNSSPPLAKAV